MAIGTDHGPQQPCRLQLRISGVVQGVGFRPTVYQLAQQRQLRGWVRNDNQGVEIVLEGPQQALHSFVSALQMQAPPRSRIQRLEQHWQTPRGDLTAFAIAPCADRDGSPGHTTSTAGISPDLAICSQCLDDLHDPSNRRYRYPFISCTQCGPRYTLLRQLPFERAHTSLAALPPCQRCAAEYRDPGDRRFHAQTISCPQCGPTLQWLSHTTSANATSTGEAAWRAAAAAIQRGEIVAVQGVGGFQLLVNPDRPEAVAELRRRKGRPDKPLALLASSPWLEQHCQLSQAERELWFGPAAPILLLHPRTSAADAHLAGGVAGPSPWLGVMRACSGLQALLLEACGGVLVATSANRSGEPLCADAQADAAALAALADGVLSHNLPIVNRIDDSVMRLAAQQPLVLRLGRGLAPLVLPCSQAATGALALGAQMKGSFALGFPGMALLSPDLGDLSSAAGASHLEQSLQQWLDRHHHQPASIGCDQHPAYVSTRIAVQLAQQLQRPLQPVQHHHAHLLAVMAEHGLAGNAIGVAWDGAGHGDDGSLWGGEALAVTPDGYQRLARLRPFRLPGGERALREPRRAALGLLVEAFGPSWLEQCNASADLATLSAFAPADRALLEQALVRGLQSPHCSSVGRLFDAVASLLGLQQCCSYEAQAAQSLEATALQACSPAQARHQPPPYPLPLQPTGQMGLRQWDWQPLLEQLLHDLQQQRPLPQIAWAVHAGLASAVAELAESLGTRQLLLSGGCFQNRLLLELSIAALQQRGITALWPQQLPCNDAAIPIGQLLHQNGRPGARSLPITGIAP